MKKFIDLRSDTVTQPTDEMRKAMLAAEVGDDVYGDDPTINRLEALAAQRLGKESAVFVPSGTMGNQISIMAQTAYGDEIIAGLHSHIVHYECGAPARLSGVNYALVDNPNDFIYPDDVRRLTRPAGDPHFPHTSLLCLENPLCNGDVVPLETLRELYTTAKELGLAVHLDGARIFNGALALGVEPRELAACADTVMFCVSKGLCAPVGSLVCSDHETAVRLRRMRKLVGGGMRQAGVLAACGIVALEQMTQRLGEDHDNAKYLAHRLNTLPGIVADEGRVKIDMIFWHSENPRFDGDDYVAYMLERGVKVYGALGSEYRLVTHNDVTRQDIDRVVGYLEEYIATLA